MRRNSIRMSPQCQAKPARLETAGPQISRLRRQTGVTSRAEERMAMTRLSCVALLVLASPVMAAQAGSGGPSSQVSATPITRVIRIPVTLWNAASEPSASPVITKGAEDELPEGPDGFDVFDDGTVILTDPLQERLMLFDAGGKFRRAWNIGFSADSVKVLPDGNVLAHDAQTGEFHGFDREGKLRPAEQMSAQASAKLLSGRAGEVMPGSPGGRTLEITMDEPGLTLISLELVGVDPDGTAYVALETTTGASSDAIDLRKNVRSYSREGTLQRQTEDIPLQYYIPPVDELRVRNGTLYQLMTTAAEVQINEWRLN